MTEKSNHEACERKLPFPDGTASGLNKLLKGRTGGKDLYRDIFLKNNAIKLLINPDSGSILDANTAACKFYQYSYEDIRKLKIWDINVLGKSETQKKMALALSGKTTDFLFRHRLASGEFRDVQVYSGVLQVRNQKLLHSIVLDITERTEAQRRAKNYSENLKATFDSVPNILVLANHEVRVEMINSKGAALVKEAKENLEGKLCGDVFKCKYAFKGQGCGRNLECFGCALRNRVEETLRTGAPHTEEEGQMTFLVGGEERTFDLLISTQLMVTEDVRKVLLSMTDISRLKQTERSLVKAREQYDLAVRGSQDGIWDWDLRDNSLFLSPKWKEMIGYEEHELPNHFSTFEKRLHPEDKPRVMNYLQQYLDGRIPVYSNEFRFRHKDGTYRWILARGEALRDENGRAYRMAGSHTDITDRIRKERYYRMVAEMLDSAPSAITIHDFEGRFMYANRKSFEIHGYEKDEFMALNLRDLDTPESKALIKERMDVIAEKGESAFDVVHMRKDGSTIPMEVSVKKVQWENRPAMLSIATDITDRKIAEKNIHAMAERLDLATRAARLGIWDWDIKNNKLVWDDGMYRLYGIEKDMFKNAYESWLNGLHPEDRLKNVRLVNLAKRGEREFDTEFRVVWPNGSIRHIKAFGEVIRDSEGNPIRMIGINYDITDRKEMEARVRQAQKMEAIGNLAGGIAHDFNNILFPIVGMSELLLEDLSGHGQEYKNVQMILDAGNRGRDLVKQILAFSRQSEHKLIPVRAQQVLREVLKLIRAAIPSNIEIEEDIQPDCGLLMADPTQIHQVAMNIITNAFHAVESNGGRIAVKLKEVHVTADEFKGGPLVDGRYALLSIADTGHGIPVEYMDKIFEPYFTTKEQGKGTGLGLAAADGIIREHKGEIRVHSEVGKGTTVDVYLPLMEASADTNRLKRVQNDPKGNEHILLVDDDAAIVNLEKQMLERLGYRVTERTSSVDALKAFRANPHAFDLVISDMTMPNMTGERLSRELVSVRPDIPIIICTGFSARIDEKMPESLGVKGVLMKPILRSKMAEMVRQVLDEAKGDDRPS